jgi:hypothetical protein
MWPVNQGTETDVVLKDTPDRQHICQYYINNEEITILLFKTINYLIEK